MLWECSKQSPTIYKKWWPYIKSPTIWMCSLTSTTKNHNICFHPENHHGPQTDTDVYIIIFWSQSRKWLKRSGHNPNSTTLTSIQSLASNIEGTHSPWASKCGLNYFGRFWGDYGTIILWFSGERSNPKLSTSHVNSCLGHIRIKYPH